jgi:hypothetical protein
MKTIYTMFNKTKELELEIYRDGSCINATDYEDTLWIERPEDWYAFMSDKYKGKNIRVIRRDKWVRAKEING